MFLKKFVLLQIFLFTQNIILGLTTPLDDYVNTPDSNYQFKLLNYSYKGNGFTLYCINMTSQKWLTENDTDSSIWYHFIDVAVPDKIKVNDTAFLYIGEGDKDPNYSPNSDDEFNWFISLMATTTGTISAVINNIPNQPIVFKNDSTLRKRYEDAIISWTWKMFIEEKSNQPEWLLRLPMTKAVVRGFDTLASFGLNHGTNLTKFMICGRSKRGWTTWTTAAVDKRVIAMAPIVMDLLSLVKNLKHHFRSLGGWTFAFGDYYFDDITQALDTDNVQKLADIVDPYSYMHRYTIPKYIVTASNDEFFIPDDSYYYFNDLPGDKFLRTLVNTNHGVSGRKTTLFLGMRAFYLSVLQNFERPKISWTLESNSTGGMITFYTNNNVPLDLNAYYGDTLDANRRDFRANVQDPDKPPGYPKSNPVIFYKKAVQNIQPGVYTAYLDNPLIGWRCFFIHATFKGPEDSNFEFTTENHIIPATFPFEECHGLNCKGHLV